MGSSSQPVEHNNGLHQSTMEHFETSSSLHLEAPVKVSLPPQLQLEGRTSWSSRIGSDLREPIVQLVLSETNTVQPEKTCN